MRILTITTLLAALAPLALAQQQGGPARGRLRQVLVTTRDVFDQPTASKRLLARLVNALHWETSEDTVRREVWLQPGEVVTAEQAAELERNLRATGLFAEVTVRLVFVDGSDLVDLEVKTSDRFSVFFGAGASYVGGVTGFRAAVGESNLFGQGDRLGVSYAENSDGEFRGSFAFNDRHLFDTWHTSTLRASRGDDGDSFSVEVRRPFKHLADPFGYGFAAEQVSDEIEYYRNADSVAQVPDRHSKLTSDLSWADGPIDRRHYAGLVFAIEDHAYQSATGPMAPDFRVPGDTQSLFVGAQARWDLVDGYREVEGLDTLDFVQDLTLGLSFGATLGARWRDEVGADAALQPELAVDAKWATEPLPEVFLNLDSRGQLRLDGGEAVGWQAHAGAWLYAMTSKRNTLCGSATLDAVEEKQDLPIELTLGEDNGLRGYPARQFAGTSRLRTNFEDRYDLGTGFATLRFGGVAFFDTGWVGDHSALGRPYTSTGLGLRIGSKPLFGGGILRIDVAKPLDFVDGVSDGWKVSVTIGQVFTFGGNATALAAP